MEIKIIYCLNPVTNIIIIVILCYTETKKYIMIHPLPNRWLPNGQDRGMLSPMQKMYAYQILPAYKSTFVLQTCLPKISAWLSSDQSSWTEDRDYEQLVYYVLKRLLLYGIPRHYLIEFSQNV